MSANQHVILKQTLQLQISRRDNHLALQQRFLRLVEEKLMPRLEPVFDRLVGPDEWVELDELAIDLGCLAPQESDQIWLDKAFRVYVEALEQHLAKLNSRPVTSSLEQNVDLLAFFLTHGVIPWWGAGVSMETLVQNQLQHLATRLPVLLSAANARLRWVRQFGDTIQQQAFDAVSARILGNTQSADALPVSLSQWLDLSPQGVSLREWRNFYWDTLWEALHQPLAFPSNWLQSLIKESISKLPNHHAMEHLVVHWLTLSGNTSLQEAGKSQPKTALGRGNTPLPETGKLQLRTALSNGFLQWFGSLPPAEQTKILQKKRMIKALKPILPPIDNLDAISAGNKTAVNKTAGNKADEDTAVQTPTPGISYSASSTRLEIGQDGLFVPLAGIVLVHPFLPTFFQRLDLLDGVQFRDTAAQEQAIHSLYYLATGLEKPAEEETVLLKILCGMEPEQAIEKELDLGKVAKEEVIRLFEAIIQNWETMAGSDPEDLRGSFFVREGKLKMGDMGWQLTVEEKAYDFLLSKLPWGLSPISHTWMREMIWVDWG